jgi:putative transposase
MPGSGCERYSRRAGTAACTSPGPRSSGQHKSSYHAERNHQGKDNVLLFPRNTDVHREGPVQCRERFGGLLRYYHQEAA